MTIRDRILLHIALIPGVGPACVAQLLQSVAKDNLHELYTFTQNDLKVVCGLQSKQAQLLHQGLKDIDMLDQECDLLEKHDIAWITCFDASYPTLLQEIHVPPIGLFVKGQLNKYTQQAIAVVGARKSNNYGQRVINNIVPNLVAHGWSILSGGALGADAMAHQATLSAGGNTVAILGSGLLRLYPYANKKLFISLVEAGGALISPFPLTMGALPGNFPARNRIIAGMSRACIVVQAGEKSGATITAYCALEQGRDVFAIPGHVDDPLSAGCHQLLRQGAILARDAQDILQELGYPYILRHLEEPQPRDGQKAELELDQQDDIVNYCKQAVSVDELFEKTGLSLSDLYARLGSLRLEGKIEQNFAGLWQKV